MSTINKKASKARANINKTANANVATNDEGNVQSLTAFKELQELVSTKTAGKNAVAEDIDDQRQEVSSQELKERETHRVGEEEYYKLRNKWSWFIFSFVSFMLLFQLFVVCAIGYQWVNFKEYQTFLHLVIGQNFAQIIGMGIIVAKFLFPKPPSKDILPTN